METTEKWYTQPSMWTWRFTVLPNQGVHTDREVTVNRPNMIIKNKKEKTRIMIEVEILAGRECHAKGRRKRS
jgi:hypothetical protein